MLTLPDFLYATAANYPDHGVGYVRHDRSVRFESFPQLLQHSRLLLGGLHNAGINPGDIVILSLDSSSEIVPMLWACFIGGIVPALLQPPVSFSSYNPAAEKAVKVFLQLDSPRVILSHQHIGGWRSSEIPPELLIDFSSLSDAKPSTELPELFEDNLALIQFSSGSTGDPKGVMLTHTNILSNIHDIIKGISLGPDDVSVNWMPLYHDMGLFGFHITPVFTGTNQYFVEPVDFVKDPLLWLDIISDKKVTITGCPNFGQMLVNRYLSRRPGHSWDFSSLRILFNGAEPISVPIMREFLERLQPFGLNPDAMFPAYGMAESTLAITFPPIGKGAEVIAFSRESLLKEGKAVPATETGSGPVELVNLGKSLDHCSLRITDDDEKPVPEATVGHVLVKGDNVTKGYYNNPEASADAFSGEWFRTGDLGFFRDGDLFITGRAKDIIFINGINYYAHDLETLAIRLPEVTFGKIVMAGYFNEQEGKDKVVAFLVSAPTDETREVFGKIKDLFSKMIGLNVDTYIPVKSSDIPRTSSGKIQRYRMVYRFLKGEFATVVRLGS